MNILISRGLRDPVNYLEAVAAAGGIPSAAYLPDGGEKYDGLILAGGGDVDPALYGQPNLGSADVDLRRDLAELALLDEFLSRGKPVLGICRGHQLINIWAGGDLIQDLGDRAAAHGGETDRVHPVRAAEGSLMEQLYGDSIWVNSSHHQGVGRLGRGLRLTALSEDGVVETMEHRTLPLISVQFHPERMTGRHIRADTVDGAAIFQHFMSLCRAVEK